MIRHIAKWSISRSLDNVKPIPSWVRFLMRHDQSLRLFAERSAELANRLRLDAEEWTGEFQPKSTSITHSASTRLTLAGNHTRSVIASRAVPWSLATAAILVAVVAMYSRQWTSNETDRTSIEHIVSNDSSESAALRATAEEKSKFGSELLAATINSSTRMIQEMSPEQLSPFLEQTAVANLFSGNDLLTGWPFPTSIEASTDLAGDVTSKVFLSLNDSMQAEQLQLLGELKRAANYFSQKLPKRAVKLVGIDVQ